VVSYLCRETKALYFVLSATIAKCIVQMLSFSFSHCSLQCTYKAVCSLTLFLCDIITRAIVYFVQVSMRPALGGHIEYCTLSICLSVSLSISCLPFTPNQRTVEISNLLETVRDTSRSYCHRFNDYHLQIWKELAIYWRQCGIRAARTVVGLMTIICKFGKNLLQLSKC